MATLMTPEDRTKLARQLAARVKVVRGMSVRARNKGNRPLAARLELEAEGWTELRQLLLAEFPAKVERQSAK